MVKRNTFGLDTTVVLRLLTQEPYKQFEAAKKYLEKGLSANKSFFVSDLVISEVYFALQYHYEVPKNKAILVLESFLSSGVVFPTEGSICRKVLKNAINHKAGFVDQLIYEQYYQCTQKFVSFDRAFGSFERTVLLK